MSGACAISSSIVALPSPISVSLVCIASSCPSSLPSTNAVLLSVFFRKQHKYDASYQETSLLMISPRCRATLRHDYSHISHDVVALLREHNLEDDDLKRRMMMIMMTYDILRYWLFSMVESLGLEPHACEPSWIQSNSNLLKSKQLTNDTALKTYQTHRCLARGLLFSV